MALTNEFFSFQLLLAVSLFSHFYFYLFFISSWTSKPIYHIFFKMPYFLLCRLLYFKPSKPIKCFFPFIYDTNKLRFCSVYMIILDWIFTVFVIYIGSIALIPVSFPPCLNLPDTILSFSLFSRKWNWTSVQWLEEKQNKKNFLHHFFVITQWMFHLLATMFSR